MGKLVGWEVASIGDFVGRKVGTSVGDLVGSEVGLLVAAQILNGFPGCPVAALKHFCFAFFQMHSGSAWQAAAH